MTAACIDIDDEPNAANEAAAAAAAEDDDTEFPSITPETPSGEDNDDDECSFILDDCIPLWPPLPGNATEGYKLGLPFE